MMNLKILIVGGSGYVGQYLTKYLHSQLGSEYEIYATYCSRNVFQEKSYLFPHLKGSYKIDLSGDHTDIKELILKLKPDFIVNPAAISAVAECQKDPIRSQKINDPSDWAEFAYQNGCKRFIHSSTDMIYHGNNGPYSETDEASPVPTMAYGVSKREAELNLLKVCSATILRYALVIGPPSLSGIGKGSTIDWMKKAIENATPESPAEFFGDELRSPVFVYDIVKVTAEIIKNHSNLPSPLILNVGGPTMSSRYDIGMAIGQRINKTNCIKSTLQKPIEGGIERPKDIRMKIDKLTQLLHVEMTTLDEAMDIILNLKPSPLND